MDISIIINMVITLIILTVVVAVGYHFLPKIEEILKDKLNISLTRGNNKGPLAQVFLKYNQRNSLQWSDWILTQDESLRQEAINKLIQHIEMSPASWGSVTPEAIMGLARFENREHITIMKSVLSAAKKMWKKYKACVPCYSAALQGIIVINEESAKKTMKDEIKKVKEPGQAIAIVQTIAEFPLETDINPLIEDILTNEDFDFNVKQNCINSVVQRDEKGCGEVFLTFLEKIIAEDVVVLDIDDSKIFEQLLNLASHDINDKVFEVLLNACKHANLHLIAIKTLQLILRTSHKDFTEDQLFMLLHLAKDKNQLLPIAMTDVYCLNSDEKALVNFRPFEEQYPFKKAPIIDETLSDEIKVPYALKEHYEALKDKIRERSLSKQSGQPGGIVLTGFAHNEKLALCRAVAAERKWAFIYASFEDMVGQPANAKSLVDVVVSHKPCLVFYDQMEPILRNQTDPFLKTMRQIASDPLVNVVGTHQDEIQIDEEGCCVLYRPCEEILNLFPAAHQITNISKSQRSFLFSEMISKVDTNRGNEVLDQDIVDPTDDMAAFDFEKFAKKYFRTSLLIRGSLMKMSDFMKLDQIDFEGRGSL